MYPKHLPPPPSINACSSGYGFAIGNGECWLLSFWEECTAWSKNCDLLLLLYQGSQNAVPIPANSFMLELAACLAAVAAFDMNDPEAVVSPGGVGFDINCGVRWA